MAVPSLAVADIIEISSLPAQESDLDNNLILDDMEFNFASFFADFVASGATTFDLAVDWINLDLNGTNETITVELFTTFDLNVAFFSAPLPLTFSVIDSVNSSGSGVLTIGPSDFSAFQNDDLLATLVFTDFSGVGNSQFPCCDGSATVSLSYETVSVPEPGTLALFGIGLVGMGLARRKKA